MNVYDSLDQEDPSHTGAVSKQFACMCVSKTLLTEYKRGAPRGVCSCASDQVSLCVCLVIAIHILQMLYLRRVSSRSENKSK